MTTLDDLQRSFADDGFACFDLSDHYPIAGVSLQGVRSMHDGAWTHIVKSRLGQFDIDPIDVDEVGRHHAAAKSDLDNGIFSFSFRRLGGRGGSEEFEPVESIKAIFESSEFKAIISSVSGRPAGCMAKFYISRFDEGHFLYTHQDPGQSVGVVLNITEGWDPNHGGLTLILEENRRVVRHCIVPAMFQLLIFDTEDRLIPHFVSMVTSGGSKPRMAVVARYNSDLSR